PADAAALAQLERGPEVPTAEAGRYESKTQKSQTVMTIAECDVRPFLLDLLTGAEFRHRFVDQEREVPERLVAMAVRRLFGCRLEEHEKPLLIRANGKNRGLPPESG